MHSCIYNYNNESKVMHGMSMPSLDEEKACLQTLKKGYGHSLRLCPTTKYPPEKGALSSSQ